MNKSIANRTKWKSMTSAFFNISLFKFNAKYHMGLEHDDRIFHFLGDIVPHVFSPPQTFVITAKSAS